MPDEDLVSYVLASLRAAHGFSREELAGRTGFDEAQISRWETGREAPSIDVLNTLLCHLKTTPAEFFKLQSLLLRIIERPDSFSEGFEESLERHARRSSEALPARQPRQVAEMRGDGRERSATDAAPPACGLPPVDGDEPESATLDQEVDVLAKETARLVESHVRLFYRALAGTAVVGEPDEED